jgi:hypothetical protein
MVFGGCEMNYKDTEFMFDFQVVPAGMQFIWRDSPENKLIYLQPPK